MASSAPEPVADEQAGQPGRGGLTGLVGDGFDVWSAQVALDRDLPVLSGFEETAVAVPATAESTVVQRQQPPVAAVRFGPALRVPPR